jgi:predicted RNA-binding protein with PUA-like domain
MAYWLMKSEPNAFSWDDLVKKGRTVWDGVRNHQAANNLRAMNKGDRAFFYHSNEGLAVVGVMAVARTHFPDPTDKSGKWVAVEMTPVAAVKHPVTLQAIKAESRLQHLLLVRHSRLSVSPIDDGAWALICGMAGIKA